MATFIILILTVAAVSAGKPGVPLGGIPTISIAEGVDMPMQGIGTWLYNSSVAQAAVFNALTLKPTPYVHIDTALIYGNQDGVGRGIIASGRDRKSFFLTTKIPGESGVGATSLCVKLLWWFVSNLFPMFSILFPPCLAVF